MEAVKPHLTLHCILEDQARARPNAPAIRAPGHPPLTYDRLWLQIQEALTTLQRMGLGQGDRIAMALPNGPDAAVAFLTLATGAVCAPLNPASPAHELALYLSALKPRGVIVLAGSNSATSAVARDLMIPIIELCPTPGAEPGLFTLAGSLDAASSLLSPEPGPPTPRPEDAALVMLTSGTTSRPKIVPLTHQNLSISAQHQAAAFALTPTDRALNLMPLFHRSGLSVILSSLAAGGSVICPHGFDAAGFFAWMDEFQPTWYATVPTMHQAILAQASARPERCRRWSLRFIRSSSTSLPPGVKEGLEAVFEAPVLQTYSMTEAALIACDPLPPRERRPGSVGIPAGAELAIIDEAGNPVPPRRTGEIAVRGPNVFAGYEEDTEANQLSFQSGWFRTGDQGYLDSDGYLFLTGRLKELINRGGEKIAPREVEEILLSHPAVAEAAVFGVPHPTLGQEVAAALVPRENTEIALSDIRAFARARLTEQKVPRQVRLVPALPREPSGKLSRAALAAWWERTKSDEAECAGPADAPIGANTHEDAPSPSSLEAVLVQIWKEVLGLEAVGLHTEFTRLGGDSLRATQLVNRLREATKVDLPVSMLLEVSTISQQAAMVAQHLADLSADYPPLPRRAATHPCPLSHAQQRLWFLEQLDPNSPLYIIPRAVRLSGKLDRDALQKALSAVVARHEALRTTFLERDGAPLQSINPPRPVDLPLIDLTGRSDAVRQEELRCLLQEEARRPFDLRNDLMLRATLFRLQPEEHVLLLTVHHIASDYWSMGILFRELSALYEAARAGESSSLPELPIQYADFAGWQRERLRGAELEALLAYWRQQVAGAPAVLELPTDRPRPATRTIHGEQLSFTLTQDLMEALKALSRQRGVTLFMTLLAAFQALLFRYTEQETFLIGTPIAGRGRLETEGLIGFFVNTLVLRADLSGDPSFLELLARVQAAARGAYAHQDLPFEMLVEALQPDRNTSRTPLVQVMFVFQNTPAVALELPGLNVTPLEVDTGTAKFDLTLRVEESANALRGVLEYSSDLFDVETMRRLLGHFQTLLLGIVANPEQRVERLPLLTEPERQELLSWGTGTQPSLPIAGPTTSTAVCLHRLFEAQVERTPDAVALVFAGTGWSYRELNQRANQWAHFLKAAGVGPGARVGIYLERSPNQVVAILAILKAGAAYVPLDPVSPPDRVAFMLADAAITVLLTERPLLAQVPDLKARVVCLDTDEELVAQQPTGNGDSGVFPAGDAYVIFTSGSTGAPKGVVVSHANVTRLLAVTQPWFTFGDQDVWTLFHSIAFDFSVWEIWGALLYGGKLVIVPYEVSRSPDAFCELLARERVTVLNQTPAAFMQLMLAEASAGVSLQHLRLVIFGGEALDPAKLKPWFARHGDQSPRLVNMYGITETTVHVTHRPLSTADASAEKGSPIGTALPDLQACVLAPNGEPVPVGIPGELYVGGEGLARAYLNRPELTAERFVPDAFGGRPGARLYRSGDRVRWQPEGELEYLGRVDRQVKVRGFRIELAEIEAVLAMHPSVRESVVLAQSSGGEAGVQIVAYVVPRKEHQGAAAIGPAGDSRTPAPTAPEGSVDQFSTDDLRRFVRQKLPEYMVPAAFVLLKSLPLTANGKVDRGALKAIEVNFAPLDAPLVAPRDRLELQLLRIWEKLLGRQRLGVRDSFFDLGGNSLLAVRLFAEIRKLCGHDLPLATLFHSPTVEGLAACLRAGGNVASWSSLVAIQPEGTRPPLFCVHGAGGNVLNYRWLAACLAPEQPVYGLQARGLGGDAQSPQRIEEMAGHYLSEIRAVQPVGPYFLCGGSFGGLVAFEMARQLEAQGETVALLALFDSFAPGRSGRGGLIRRIPGHIDLFKRLGPRDGLRYLRARTRAVTGKLLRRAAWKLAVKPSHRLGRPLPATLWSVEMAHLQAARAYLPHCYTGRITLFRARDRSIGSDPDPEAGWGTWAAGGVDVHEVPGDHLSLLGEPHVQIVAQRLKDCVCRAMRALEAPSADQAGS